MAGRAGVSSVAPGTVATMTITTPVGLAHASQRDPNGIATWRYQVADGTCRYLLHTYAMTMKTRIPDPPPDLADAIEAWAHNATSADPVRRWRLVSLIALCEPYGRSDVERDHAYAHARRYVTRHDDVMTAPTTHEPTPAALRAAQRRTRDRERAHADARAARERQARRRTTQHRCLYCGRYLPKSATTRRRYCGTRCRVAAHRGAHA